MAEPAAVRVVVSVSGAPAVMVAQMPVPNTIPVSKVWTTVELAGIAIGPQAGVPDPTDTVAALKSLPYDTVVWELENA